MNNYQLKSKLVFEFDQFIRKNFLFIKNLINYFLFIILKTILSSKNEITKSESILFVNSEKLGDLILSFDFLYSFQQGKSFSEKFLLIDEQYKGLFELTSLRYKLITYQKQKYKFNLLYRISLLKKISVNNFDSIANISPERGSLNDEITILIKSKNKIGLKSKSPFYFNLFNNIYKGYYSLFIDSKNKNEYEILKDYLLIYKIELKKYFDKRWERNIEDKIVIAPSSSVQKRNWSIDNFRRLAKELSKSFHLIIIGTLEQQKIIENITHGIMNTEIQINKSYRELFELIASSSLFIGLDSGLTHLALQLKRPIVSIIGGGKYGIFFPYKEHDKNYFAAHKMDCFTCFWNCKYKYTYCIKYVLADEIISACNKILTEKSK